MTKAKFKLSQLASVDTKDVELVHPKHGDTGMIVTLAGPTHPVWVQALETFKASPQSSEDNLHLLASTVISWDEEAFEVAHSHDAVVAALKDKKNEWMTSFLSHKILDNTTFFL